MRVGSKCFRARLDWFGSYENYHGEKFESLSQSPKALDTPESSIEREMPIDAAIMINKLKSMTSSACAGVIQPHTKQTLANRMADCSMGITSAAGKLIMMRKLTMGM
jgi:hypothetical protein